MKKIVALLLALSLILSCGMDACSRLYDMYYDLYIEPGYVETE